MIENRFTLLIDVETANDVDCPFTYDVSARMTDFQGNIWEERAYVIRDIFVNERELMETAYYADKIPEYVEDLRAHRREMANFMYMRRELLDMMAAYDCHTVAAYNCSFDRNALNNTLRYITKSKYRWFFPYDTEFICIWNIACQSICQTKEYKMFAEEHQLISNYGHNYRATAETVFAFLSNNPNFTEEHKGLEDVQIENQILTYCLNNFNEFDKGMGINRGCWNWVKREID